MLSLSLHVKRQVHDSDARTSGECDRLVGVLLAHSSVDVRCEM